MYRLRNPKERPAPCSAETTNRRCENPTSYPPETGDQGLDSPHRKEKLEHCETAAWKDTLSTQGTTPPGKTTVRQTHRPKVENRKVPRGRTAAGNGDGCRVVAGIKPGPSHNALATP
jgi:hypothetical protein